mmetsp:Transcript_8246/g.10848  ORF Transcript_8246/g.10848 Transcript_8246/m.10848 type:complete len:82 (-) Transcript_8246:811-1056(-)
MHFSMAFNHHKCFAIKVFSNRMINRVPRFSTKKLISPIDLIFLEKNNLYTNTNGYPKYTAQSEHRACGKTQRGKTSMRFIS